MKLPTLLIAAGILMMGAAFVLPSIVGGARALPPDAQKKLEESGKYHEIVHMHAHSEGNENRAAEPLDKAALEREHKELMAQIETARTRGTGTAFVLRWVGVMTSSIGLIAFLVKRA